MQSNKRAHTPTPWEDQFEWHRMTRATKADCAVMHFNKYTHTHTHTFWTLRTSANLSALGQKARQVACGDVLRRVIGAVFCRRYGKNLADYFHPWGLYGVAVSDGVEIMALAATLVLENGCTFLSYDGANALNSIYRHRFLPALAEIVPSVVPTHQTCTHGNPKTPVCMRWRAFGSG